MSRWNMNESLGVQWEQFVKEKVQIGHYQTASEVLRDGLRLLEQRQKSLLRRSPQSKKELEEMLEVGIRQFDAGKGVPGRATSSGKEVHEGRRFFDFELDSPFLGAVSRDVEPPTFR